MRIGLGFVLAVTLGLGLGVQVADAGVTVLEKEFVGNVENKNKIGNGDQSAVETDLSGNPLAARLAGSMNSIAEGPPPGRSNYEGCLPSEQDPDGNCFEDFVGEDLFRVPYSAEQCERPEYRVGYCSKSGWLCNESSDCPWYGDNGHDGPVAALVEGGDYCMQEEGKYVRATDELRGNNCPGVGSPDRYVALPFPDSTGGGILKEQFRAYGAVQSAGRTSVNGYPVFQNLQYCPEIGGNQKLPTDYQWTFALGRQPVSDIQVQICMDVRKCQEEEDNLGQASTQSLEFFKDSNGFEYPAIIRVVHHRGKNWDPFQTIGPSSCPCEDRSLVDIVNPTLRAVRHPKFPEEEIFTQFDLAADVGPPGYQQWKILDESIAFIGKDCIIKTVKNDGMIAPFDYVTVQVKVPGGTRVRVLGAQDSAALCYIGTLNPGEGI